MAVAAGAAACTANPDDVNFDAPMGWTAESITSACTRDAILAGTPANRRAIVERALAWVDQGVPYSQTPQPREAGYRTDCSGLVSMAWQLPAPGHTTYSFAGGPWDDHVSHRIDWSELAPGDALNSPQHHIMLFAGWLDENRTRFCTIEEYNWGHPATILHHSIYDGAEGSDVRHAFLPVRLDAAPAPSPAPSTPATGGTGSTPAAAQCFSNTLGRWMPDHACVESRFDRAWYQCVGGVWRVGHGSYGACTSDSALAAPTGTATCFSGTLGHSVADATCLQSRFDGAWYQCTDSGWVIDAAIPSTRRGPIGACATIVPLH